MIAKHPGECKPHEYQDTRYGKGFRVMNPAYTSGKLVGHRCTVCGPPKVHSSKRPGIYSPDQLQVLR